MCWYLKLTFMFIFCVNILCWYCAKCNFTWDWSRMGLKHNLPKVWQTASLQSLEAITLQIIIITMHTHHQQHLYESHLRSTSSACQPQKPSKGIWDWAAVIIMLLLDKYFDAYIWTSKRSSSALRESRFWIPIILFIKVYIQDDPPRPSGPKNGRGPVETHAYSGDDEAPGYVEEDCLEVEGEADPLVILVVPEFKSIGIFERRRIGLKDQEWEDQGSRIKKDMIKDQEGEGPRPSDLLWSATQPYQGNSDDGEENGVIKGHLIFSEYWYWWLQQTNKCNKLEQTNTDDRWCWGSLDILRVSIKRGNSGVGNILPNLSNHFACHPFHWSVHNLFSIVRKVKLIERQVTVSSKENIHHI